MTASSYRSIYLNYVKFVRMPKKNTNKKETDTIATATTIATTIAINRFFHCYYRYYH